LRSQVDNKRKKLKARYLLLPMAVEGTVLSVVCLHDINTCTLGFPCEEYRFSTA